MPKTDFSDCFSGSYAEARRRFVAAAEGAGAAVEAFPIGQRGPQGENLYLDVAYLGPKRPERPERMLVVSCGTHGIEGYFGSAVQLAYLQHTIRRRPAEVGILFLHGINPYGFAWRRRVDENNVDLNRNFMRSSEAYGGAHPDYRRLDALLNPPSPPRKGEAFYLRCAYHIVRHGFAALKNAIVQGQYEFPKGLFYGGRSPGCVAGILQRHLNDWLRGAKHVVHLDFHTGMGKWGTYVLAVGEPLDSPGVKALQAAFGAEAVQAFDPGGVLYEIRGAFGPWLRDQAKEAGVDYHCLLAEFGTYSPLRALRALRQENRAHHHGAADAAVVEAAKAELMEVFAPARPAWRQQAVRQGLSLIDDGLRALQGQAAGTAAEPQVGHGSGPARASA